MKKIILTLTLLLSLAIPAYNQGSPTYPLTMSAGSYGTVLPATETVDSGAVINIYASPKPGYVLTSWHQTGGAHIADTTKDTTTVHLSAAGACAASFHWRATAPIYSYYLNQSTGVYPDWPTLCRDRYNRIWSAYNVASGGTGSHYGTKYCNWIIQQVEWKRDTMINLGPQITIEAGSAPVDSFAGRGHCIVPIRTPGDTERILCYYWREAYRIGSTNAGICYAGVKATDNYFSTFTFDSIMLTGNYSTEAVKQGCQLHVSKNVVIAVQDFSPNPSPCILGAAISTDYGRTHTFHTILTSAQNSVNNLNESGIAETRVSGQWTTAGNLIMFSRNQTAPYYYFKCTSADGGNTWTTPAAVAVGAEGSASAPGQFVRSPDQNTLYFVYGFGTLRILQSIDEGVTWTVNNDSALTWGYMNGLYASPIFDQDGKLAVAWACNNMSYTGVYFTSGIDVSTPSTSPFKVAVSIPALVTQLPYYLNLGRISRGDSAMFLWRKMADPSKIKVTDTLGNLIPRVIDTTERNLITEQGTILVPAASVSGKKILLSYDPSFTCGDSISVLTNKLVRSYGFNDWVNGATTLIDRCGNGNGTNYTSPTLFNTGMIPTIARGTEGWSYQFYTGNTDYIDIGAIPQINGQHKVSWGFKIMRTSTATVTLFGCDPARAISDHAAWLVITSSYIWLSFHEGGEGYYSECASTPLTLNVWHTLVLTYNTGAVKTFVDGIDQSSTDNGTVFGTWPACGTKSYTISDPTNSMDGYIDEAFVAADTLTAADALQWTTTTGNQEDTNTAYRPTVSAWSWVSKLIKSAFWMGFGFGF